IVATMNLLLAFRSLFKKNQGNLIKIVSLGLGLAAGLILITKALFEVSYDDFYPDSKDIYMVQSRFQQGDDPEVKFPQVSGAIAPGIRDEAPQVVAATRMTHIRRDAVLLTADRNRLVGTVILADSCFFDLLPRPMLVGVAKEVLSMPMHALVSSKIAEKMDYNAVGQTIQLDDYPGRELIIGGVFEALPHNSSFKYDVIVSLSSIGRFFWDGTNNWMGNDRYTGFVKLQKNIYPDDLTLAIRRMQEKHQDILTLEAQYGVKLNYDLIPLIEYHGSNPEVKRKVKLLSWIAFALIFTAILNYVLVVISAHVRRAKEMAVYKSYGAGKRHISQLIYMEVLVHLMSALVVAALMIWLFRPIVEELLGSPLSALLRLQSGFVLLVIVALIFVVIGVIPARLFSAIPVATAFRSFKQSRRSWMLSLLFVQLAAATFLVGLLAVIGLQYRLMVNDNPGYSFEQTASCSVLGTSTTERQTALEQLSRLSNVQLVATAKNELFYGASGNNVSLPGEDRELFNMADLYGIDENYLALMDISIIEGRGFERGVSTERDMVVSKSFVKRVLDHTDWSDGIVGKDLWISEHGLCRVVGVYDDVRLGFIGREDTRPSAMFYSSTPAATIFIRFHKLDGEGIKESIDILQSVMPNKDIVVTPYKDSMLKGYNEQRLYRNSVFVGSLIAILLSLVGLLAYLRSEINRRSAEIAIRKVNGATISNVLTLLSKNVLYLALPALVLGAAIARYVSDELMKSFSTKIELSFLLFTVCCLLVLTVTLGILIAGSWRVAVQNPVLSLKSE
ncbi:MAG: ABC transporter permease, partial [Bacteroidales bacterium]|nr:ABC transporter permease [Bacteroidales bacterium]